MCNDFLQKGLILLAKSNFASVLRGFIPISNFLPVLAIAAFLIFVSQRNFSLVLDLTEMLLCQQGLCNEIQADPPSVLPVI